MLRPNTYYQDDQSIYLIAPATNGKLKALRLIENGQPLFDRQFVPDKAFEKRVHPLTDPAKLQAIIMRTAGALWQHSN